MALVFACFDIFNLKFIYPGEYSHAALLSARKRGGCSAGKHAAAATPGLPQPHSSWEIPHRFHRGSTYLLENSGPSFGLCLQAAAQEAPWRMGLAGKQSTGGSRSLGLDTRDGCFWVSHGNSGPRQMAKIILPLEALLICLAGALNG